MSATVHGVNGPDVDVPTKAEFDALVAKVDALVAKVNTMDARIPKIAVGLADTMNTIVHLGWTPSAVACSPPEGLGSITPDGFTVSNFGGRHVSYVAVGW